MEDKKECPKCKGTMWRRTSLLSREIDYSCEKCGYIEVVRRGRISKENKKLLRNLNKSIMGEVK